MRGFIVTNSTSSSYNTHQKVNSLVKEFKLLSIPIEVFKASELHLSYQSGKYNFSINILDYDFCIFLDKDKYLAEAINSLIPMFNSADAILKCDDKMLTYQALNSCGIKTPLTIPCSLNHTNCDDEELLNYIISSLEYPFIAKKVYGSLGKDVTLINNKKELLDFYHSFINQPHLYQEYVDTERGTDYRLITIGHKVVSAMKRHNEYDFRSNIALGGVGTKIELPYEYIDMAEKSSQILGLDYAGIDILKGKDDEPILNEINSNAFFTEIERVSKVNISKLLVEHILRTIK